MSSPSPVSVVFGTAGHIDHGKSALIASLCGTHPDRLAEEKERGMTLGLGYGEMQHGDNFEIGFVDVPGHKKLVRKMVAGASGMNAALLVIACNDGVMPQTKEHFEVLRLLNINEGLIVLTKSDLADEDTVEIVKLEVSELTAGTLWAENLVLEVSSQTGSGLEVLRDEIYKLANKLASKKKESPKGFVLNSQRSFSLEGSGTVATGVCASGELAVGEEVYVFPEGKKSRVRRIHVHGRDCQKAIPGVRTALNLPDVSIEDCGLGATLVEPDIAHSGDLARIAFRWVDGATKWKSGESLHFLAGTAEIKAKLYLYPQDRSSWQIGDLLFPKKHFLAHGQCGLLRHPSMRKNLASAYFLGFPTYRLRRKNSKEISWWKDLFSLLDDPLDLIRHFLQYHPGRSQDIKSICHGLSLQKQGAIKLLTYLVDSGEVRALSDTRYLAMGEAQLLLDELSKTVEYFKKNNANRLRIPTSLLRQRVGKDGWGVVNSLDEEALKDVGLLKCSGEYWRLVAIEIDPEFLKKSHGVLEKLESSQLQPPEFSELADSSYRDYLLDSGLCVSPDGNLVFATSVVLELAESVIGQLDGDGMDIPMLRDKFSTSRKYLMPLLEFFDKRGLTERVGSKRILRDRCASLSN